ncbi:MAG TPA: hypothetical protein DCZ48_01570 [Methylococcaceae bacterium]|nr:hypothetical protein [Methylococcaceae bacterium]
MKFLPRPIICERCGDEILPSEQSRPDDCICPWCRHMIMEAGEIHQKNKRKRSPHLILLNHRN